MSVLWSYCIHCWYNYMVVWVLTGTSPLAKMKTQLYPLMDVLGVQGQDSISRRPIVILEACHTQMDAAASFPCLRRLSRPFDNLNPWGVCSGNLDLQISIGTSINEVRVIESGID